MEYELRGGYPLNREEFKRRMRDAERHLFSLGVGDAAEEVGRVNVTLFLAKIHFIQEQLGNRPYAMFIGAPDFTFQTSPYKFHEAVPEGGKIIWGDGTYNFVPAEIEPDFCGLLAGAVENGIDLEEVLDTLHEMRQKDSYYVGNTKIELHNFRPSSHFLNLYGVDNHKALNLPESVAVLHTSSDEMRDLLSDLVRERAEEMRTPFGVSRVLRGSDAWEYQRRCRDSSDFTKKKRKLLFEEIFGHGEIIANHNHYELTGPNGAVIGCSAVNEEGEVFVITLIDGSPAYLVKGRKNLTPRKIEELGFDARKIEKWAYDGLLNANIVPHGGGHKLIEVDGVAKVILYPGAKVIVPRYRTKVGTTAYVDMETAFRGYRSDGILERVRALELADHYATLKFIYGIKVDF